MPADQQFFADLLGANGEGEDDFAESAGSKAAIWSIY